MGQVTLYLDAETESRMKSAAADAGQSRSRWVADLIRARVARTWPEHVRSLAGAWEDFPTAEEIRASAGTDTPREPW